MFTACVVNGYTLQANLYCSPAAAGVGDSMSIDNLSVLSRRRDIDLVNDTPSSRFTTSSSIVRSVKPSRPLYVQTSAYAKGIPRCSSFVILG
jgi:hypothetical protein